MRTIICKKCGTPIDASLGECPVCGAVYYILPEESDEDESTRVWDRDTEEISAAIRRETDPAAAGGPSQPLPGPRPARTAPDRRTPDRRGIFAALAALALAILTVVLCFMNGVFDFSPRQTMPDVVGLTKDVALGQLRSLNISPNVIYEESDLSAEQVIRQSPEADRALSGRENVTIIVSTGPGAAPGPDTVYAEVPNVVGDSYAAAAAALAKAGLVPIRSSEAYSDSVPAGGVARQSPLPGARLPQGGEVLLTVSKGPEARTYSVVLTAGKGGSIEPSGRVEAAQGESLSFALVPDEGYELAEVRIDGVSVGQTAEYTLTDISGDHSVYAVFAAIPEESQPPEESQAPTESAPPTESVPPLDTPELTEPLPEPDAQPEESKPPEETDEAA